MKRVILLVPLGIALACGCESRPPQEAKPCPDPPGSAALPARPQAPIGDGPPTVFAVSKIFLGDTDRNGAPNPTNGWKSFGFDIDHRASVKDSCGLCTPWEGASKASVYPDGNGGIDNSFGSNILPILLGFEPDGAAKLNQEIESGARTLLLRIDGLGSAPSSGSLGGAFFHSGALEGPPKWDGSDAWPVTEDSLLVPSDPSSAKVTFKSSYLIANRWVSDPPATVLLEVPFLGVSHLRLLIHDAVFVVDVAADRQSGTNGVIAGILDVSEFAAEPQRLAGFIDRRFCMGSSARPIVIGVRQAADILLDGSQDPNKTCNGISIGLGFEMKVAKIGGVVPAEPPDPDPCLDGGAADGG